ncbi:hypothetical protein MTO98_08475 [Mucilaginibacter sp. SMC90]|uniref:hypothetical protein n=1 Tax=Mucilaginibacter sp. SMC90 TaxID=2929803 RepID=UPI001FB48455|nr:hypothetical protein [Mucilaginibacter sp. SMC90]UOE51108.1 hypothetical protein MTO98_08475 [Mucilaginibacter sp. SMC90]
MKKVLFEESQKNVQILAVVPAVITTILFGVLSFLQVLLHKPVGNNPAPDWLLLVFFFGSIIGFIVFSSQKLKTQIREDEITVSFGFFARKKVINISEVKSISIRKYDAIKEFLGWGVRFNLSERCYTVAGSDGIEIELVNGKRILVGTQKPLDADLAILNYLPNKIIA